MFEAKIPLPELKDDADLGGAPAWSSRTIGRPPACESPKEPCLYCDLPAPEARMEMRLRSGLTCGQPAGPCQRHSRFTQSTPPSAAAASRARLSFGYQ